MIILINQNNRWLWLREPNFVCVRLSSKYITVDVIIVQDINFIILKMCFIQNDTPTTRELYFGDIRSSCLIIDGYRTHVHKIDEHYP